jgi:hypothetical protein
MAIIGNMYSEPPFVFFKYPARTVELLISQVIIIILLDTLRTSTLTSKDVINTTLLALQTVSRKCHRFLSCKHRTLTNC